LEGVDVNSVPISKQHWWFVFWTRLYVPLLEKLYPISVLKLEPISSCDCPSSCIYQFPLNVWWFMMISSMLQILAGSYVIRRGQWGWWTT
jgi:hypothetical protein